MGISIERDRFEDADYHFFDERLDRCLSALAELLERPGFGTGPRSLGAELEVALVDAEARPLPLNVEVLRETLDPRMTVELNRFNLECNLRHTDLAGHPFAALRSEIDGAHAELCRAAARRGGRIAMVGILPTLEVDDLQGKAMTNTARFRALSNALQRARRRPFLVEIDGEEPLQIECNDVTFEGAATSLQLHLRVDPADFNDVFNAVQLATAPALAVAGNSPTFLGQHLWEETRVALFKQAVDDRSQREKALHRAPRVSFGSRWIRGGALELFGNAISEYPTLLPVVAEEDPRECLRAGGVPALEEIRLHQGTVWHWNRPVYDPADGGHLRIEMRALPAGPSAADMVANAALLVGLALDLAPEITRFTEALPFEEAHRNFYRAAQRGLAAELVWPSEPGERPAGAPAHVLVPQLLPRARRGLVAAGVDPAEADACLAVIEARCQRQQTGAGWQRSTLRALEAATSRKEALAAMVDRYIGHSQEGAPVHAWPIPA